MLPFASQCFQSFVWLASPSAACNASHNNLLFPVQTVIPTLAVHAHHVSVALRVAWRDGIGGGFHGCVGTALGSLLHGGGAGGRGEE